MADILPFFPLNLVVYPGEELNLHVFEPRYRQLINECLDTGAPFGIPAFINNKIPGFGTEVKVTQLAQRHADGRMDIKTIGVRVFKMVVFKNPVVGKLYSGGEVIFPKNEDYQDVMPGLLERLKRLYQLMQVPLQPFDSDAENFSFTVAHKIGLSLEEEYELLALAREAERQAYLIRHLERVLPVVAEMERTKERIRLNGHFKNLDPLTF